MRILLSLSPPEMPILKVGVMFLQALVCAASVMVRYNSGQNLEEMLAKIRRVMQLYI